MTRIPLSHIVDGSGPGILLAHGGGGGIEANYGSLIPALAEHHTVVGPDYPGSGATPRAADGFTAEDLADSIVAAADEAGLDTFTVIGFSLGTLVAVKTAARYPERVRGLVLAAGLAAPDNRVTTALGIWRGLLSQGDLTDFARFNLLSAFSEEYVNALPAEELDKLIAGMAADVPSGAFEQAGAILRSDTRGDLAGISVPTLVVAATRDNLVSPDNSRFLASRIPGAEYAELATGHLPMVERPEEWRKLVLDFLARKGL
ncbi:alpha/beta fold hydrolase [Streptomyces orinoci]|uniref:Alpha/beta hydrolase n=1 Tax=Streptomyces orinoci TaxID=67339 RepID=A0ABV3JUD6_STRON|nr:alpha/beta hydrolase [Streptomyces orinoci]